MKAALAQDLEAQGFRVIDLGTNSADSVDYPDFADAVAAAIAGGRAQWGVLVCGTGIGMGIAANRHKAIRAAVVHDALSAKLARQHNDANVATMGARLLGDEAAKDAARAFFATAFEGGGRHERRVAKLGK